MSDNDLRILIRKQWNQQSNLIELLHIAWRYNSRPAVERWLLVKGQKEIKKYEQLKKAAASSEQTA